METPLYSCDVCQHHFMGEALVALHILICHPHVGDQGWTGSHTESGYHPLDDTCDLSGASYKNTAMALAESALEHHNDGTNALLDRESYLYLLSWQKSVERTARHPVQLIGHAFAVRERLVELLIRMDRKEDQASREALLKDDIQTAHLLKHILNTESLKYEILELLGSAAEAVLDIIHTVVSESNLWIADAATMPGTDNACLADSVPKLLQFRRALMWLNVRISQRAKCLPSTLHLTCDQREQQPVTCGAYSDIYRGTYKSKRVALKTFRAFQTQTPEQRAKSIRRLHREILLLSYLSHPNISELLGFSQEAFNNGQRVPCLVSNWMDHGNMPTYIETKKPKPQELLRLAIEIAEGLAYLHESKVVHGDLHANNVLIDEREHAKLTDFGLSSFLDWTTSSGLSATSAGAPRWMAPEILSPQSFGLEEAKHTASSDMYSFGCILWQMFSGTEPFSHLKPLQICVEIPRGTRSPRSLSPKPIADEIWQCIDGCWKQDQKARPLAVAASFALQFYSSQMLKTLARRRITGHASTRRMSSKGSTSRSRTRSVAPPVTHSRSHTESDNDASLVPAGAFVPNLVNIAPPRNWSCYALVQTAQSISRPQTALSTRSTNRLPQPRLSVRYLACTYPGAQDLVSQRAYGPPVPVIEDHLQDHIMFYTNKKGDCGIACPDAWQGKFEHLDGHDDTFTFAQGSITIRILWPGCHDWSHVLRLRTKGNVEPTVSRSTLAKYLAGCTQKFLKNAEFDPNDRDERDRCDLTSGNVKFENLEIVGMQNLIDQDWQVHFRLRR